MSEPIIVLLNATFSFLYLFFIAKVLGKKQIAELDFTDYVVGITIGSIAAEWSTDTVNPWYYYAIGMGVFFILSLSISLLEITAPWLKIFLRGKPKIVINNGKIDFKSLKSSKLDVNELLSLCRTQGYFNIAQIQYAMFETNGELSILPKGSERPTVASDMNIKIEEAQKPCHIIVEGRINKNALIDINKNKDWLFKKLKITNKKQLKNIVLAIYDEKLDSIETHIKN